MNQYFPSSLSNTKHHCYFAKEHVQPSGSLDRGKEHMVDLCCVRERKACPPPLKTSLSACSPRSVHVLLTSSEHERGTLPKMSKRCISP